MTQVVTRTWTYWPPREGLPPAPPLYLLGHPTDDDPDMLVVNDVVESGGWIAEGVHVEWDPAQVKGVRKISEFGTRPNLRTLRQQRVAILAPQSEASA